MTPAQTRFYESIDYLGPYGLNQRYLAFARKGSPAHRVQYGQTKWLLKGHWSKPNEMTEWGGLYVLHRRDEWEQGVLKWRVTIGRDGNPMCSWYSMPRIFFSVMSLKVFPLMEVIPCS